MATYRIPESARPLVERLRWQCYLACLTGILANSEIPLTDQAAADKARGLSVIALKQYLEDAFDRGTDLTLLEKK